MKAVAYFPAAEHELLNEIVYLERQSRGLGRRFLHEVQYLESELARFPLAGREVGDGVRTRQLRKFPYSVMYHVDDETVYIVALAHHSRRPNCWRDRLVPQKPPRSEG